MAEEKLQQQDGNVNAIATETNQEQSGSSKPASVTSDPAGADKHKSETPKTETPATGSHAPAAAKAASAPIVAPPAKDFAPRAIGPRPRVAEKPGGGKFALLASSVAVAACFGALIGSLAVTGLTGMLASSSAGNELSAEVKGLKEIVGHLGSDLATMKASLDQSARLANVQAGKIAERLDRSERSQAEPAAKLAKLVETLDRLERRVAIAAPAAAAAAPAAAPAVPAPAAPAQGDVTGTVAPQPEAKAAPKPNIIEGWYVRKVSDGVAVIEGPRGSGEVEPGDVVPVIGKVQEIRRQDGRWVVVTNKGLILSRPER